MTYKEFEIRKKSGKTRKIVAPNPELKKYQRSKLEAYNDKFKELSTEAGVNHVFHGFIPQRNCITAAQHHIGFQTTKMYDLSNFFDTVTLKHLNDAKCYIPDKDVKYLLHEDGYCAQGFPTSPTLCNIALIPLVASITRTLVDTHGKDNFAFTIYADDLAISINETSKEHLKALDELVIEKADTYGFIINPNKTRVKFAKYGARRILGVNVFDTHIQATRKTNKKVRAVQGYQRFNTDKGQVLGGLRTWQTCALPKALRDTFQL